MIQLGNFRNANGTYNGVKALSALTGLSEAEVKWTDQRIKELVVDLKIPRAQAVAQVRREAESKPWVKP